MTTPIPNDLTGYYPTMDPKYQIKDPTTGDVNPNGIYSMLSSYGVLTPSSIMNSANGGMIGAGISNPNEASGGWNATNLDTGSMHQVSDANYNLLTDSTHSNRDLLQSMGKIAAMIYGGAAATGSLGSAGLGFGGGAAAGVGDVASGYGISPGFAGGGEADVLGPGGLFGTAGAPSTLGGLDGGGASSFGTAAAGTVGAGTSGLGAFGGASAGIGGAYTAGTTADTIATESGGAGNGGGSFLSNLLGGKGVGSLIGDVAGAVVGTNAANQASGAITDATDKQLALSRENRDILLGMNKPFYDASTSALSRLMDMTGLSGKPVDNQALLNSDPSYQFRRDESMRVLESGGAARGGLLSGDFGRTALQEAGKYASQEYANIYGRIAGIAGYGQPATNSSGQGLISFANMQSTALGDQGAGNASGYVAKGNVLMDLASKLGNTDWSKIGSKP